MKSLAALQALCLDLAITVKPTTRPSKEPYVEALRQYFWQQDHPGVPLSEQIEPMLLADWRDLNEAEATAIEAKDSGWCIQEKKDGVRALLHVTKDGIRITGRTFSEVNFRLSEFQDNLPHLADGLEALVGTILDGELVCPADVVDTGDTITASRWNPLVFRTGSSWRQRNEKSPSSDEQMPTVEPVNANGSVGCSGSSTASWEPVNGTPKTWPRN